MQSYTLYIIIKNILEVICPECLCNTIANNHSKNYPDRNKERQKKHRIKHNKLQYLHIFVRMIRFDSDYLEGAHPEIIKRLADTNFEQTPGYGQDPHCENARRLIKEACAAPNAHVHFLVGGTQANVTVIASALKPYQGVICATTGHINVHETGAVEHSGHKALAIHGKDGKITAQQIDSLIENHYADASFEHTVQPGMVYISFPTELGTLYTLQELTDISTVCRKHDIPLFIDGARLGYGLMSQQSNVTLKDIARLSDIFT